ncbi:MAG: type II secretion system protein N [Planctomycetota bacterium]|jgi:type II secretory pathway component PulC
MKKGTETYIPGVMFISKLGLVVLLVYVLVKVVTMSRPGGEVSVPTSAASVEDISAVGAEGPRGDSVEDYSVIIERSIFGEGASPVRGDGLPRGRAAHSAGKDLRLALLGTVAGSPSVARAIIRDLETDKLGIYKTGDTVAAACIEHIERDEVVLLHQGRRKILALGDKESNAPGRDNIRAPAVTRGAVRTAKAEPSSEPRRPPGGGLRDVGAILRKATVRPHVVSGETEGLRITGLESLGWSDSVALKNGDVIRAINGHRLTSKQKAYQVLKKARSQPIISLELLRDNETKNLSFSPGWLTGD